MVGLQAKDPLFQCFNVIPYCAKLSYPVLTFHKLSSFKLLTSPH